MNQNIDDFREWDDCALVTRQISRRLLEQGYPGDLDICWRLSCCQGDGVCFYGTLDRDTLPRLLGRLLADDKEALSVLLPLAEAGELVTELCRNHFGYRYTHANCIAIRTECDADEFTGVAEAVERYETALSEDIRSVCHQAEQDGYALLHDAFNPDSDERILYRRASRHFQLCVEAKPSDYICFFGSTQEVDVMLDKLIDGHARLIGVSINVSERYSDVSLNTCFDTLLIPETAPRKHWLPGDLLRDVISGARYAVTERLACYRSFRTEVRAA
ncbi:hypothetical protein [Providencia rettgeri]|uniref:hypothetical protein n=1 Tax=Providencia rettgeri TaxID=587 RepID=UPI0024AC3458